MDELSFEPQREEHLREMLKTGQAYTHEVRHMAAEILELRRKLQPEPYMATYKWTSFTP